MSHYNDYIVSPTDSITASMKKISRNKHRVVIVVDQGKVIGTVSDGDIRRAFLDNVLAIAPVEKIMNINCRTTTVQEPQKLREIILQEKVTVLPVVNDMNELVDVFVADEPLASNR